VIIPVHSIRVPNAPGRAIFDCFRFDDNGKAAEHRDAIQDIPVKAANSNGMFWENGRMRLLLHGLDPANECGRRCMDIDRLNAGTDNEIRRMTNLMGASR
jgi:hypothetical protein